MQERPTVLLPVRVLEGESIPEGIPDILSNAHVVLLGYHVVPDQTATDQARKQFEDQATRRLDEFETILEDAGADVESTLVFTHHGQKTIDRMITEHDCLSVLIPNATRPLEAVLVAVRGTIGIDRIARLVAGLFAETDTDVTLYHVAEENETDDDVETLLDGMATRLVEAGMDADRVDTRVARDGNPRDVIIDDSEEFDAIVMGESDPSVTTFIFGMRAEQVAKEFLGPVFVVQREKPESTEETG